MIEEHAEAARKKWEQEDPPADLDATVREMLANKPTRAWDAVLREIAGEDDE